MLVHVQRPAAGDAEAVFDAGADGAGGGAIGGEVFFEGDVHVEVIGDGGGAFDGAVFDPAGDAEDDGAVDAAEGRRGAWRCL